MTVNAEHRPPETGDEEFSIPFFFERHLLFSLRPAAKWTASLASLAVAGAFSDE